MCNRLISFAILFSSAIALAADAPSPATRSTQPVLDERDVDFNRQLQVPEGYEVKLWAQTPDLFNPTNIDIDARGRVWVTEGVNYRESWGHHHTLHHPDGDRATLLRQSHS